MCRFIVPSCTLAIRGGPWRSVVVRGGPWRSVAGCGLGWPRVVRGGPRMFILVRDGSDSLWWSVVILTVSGGL